MELQQIVCQDIKELFLASKKKNAAYTLASA